ncbi:hypothetical protein HMPREF0063_12100 [Aeromicrobium marinum DSM 15272]|uniref:Tat pathway signal sequence domain protein n=1 Tax=Aeromicrobium marinum DSM 15272 TaxID=585531 RepID=E2SCD8_9ACTN|nr:hypothetical protein HMPREF0063_12100 [Aeromicrobium marinum DSM 15272]
MTLVAVMPLWAGTVQTAQAAPAVRLSGDSLNAGGNLLSTVLGSLLDPVLDPILTPVLGAVGGVTGPVTDAACDAAGGIGGALGLPACPFDLSFRTELQSDDGVTTRMHAATVGVPTSLNVDGDPAPDLVATVGLAADGQVGLTVTAHPLQSGPLPVSVEAVLSDFGPIVGANLPAETISFGYDARADRAPGEFTLTARLASLLDGELDLSLAQSDLGSRIAVIADLVDGDVAAPEQATAISLDYLTSPQSALIQVGIADPRKDLSATLTQPSTGTVVVEAVIDRDGDDADVTADSRTTATVTIDEIPSSLSIDLLRPRDGIIEVDYDATARIDALDVGLRLDALPAADGLDPQVQVAIADVAPSLNLSVDTTGETVSSTDPAGGPIVVTFIGDPSSAPGDTSVESVVAQIRDLEGLPDLDLSIAKLPQTLSLCFDRGPACRRDEGRERPDGNGYTPHLSIDAVSSHTSDFVTVNAAVDTDDGEIRVEDLRFRELAVDTTEGPDREIFRVALPRIAVFVDSDDQPFTIGNVTFGAVDSLRLGSVSNPARAQDRFLWITGYRIVNLLLLRGAIEQELAGTLECGGNRVLAVKGFNLLDFGIFGLDPVDLCS